MLANQEPIRWAARVAMVTVATAFFSSGTKARANDTPKTADVLQTLHLSDEKEIAAGKLAEMSGKSSQVKDYGKMLQKDHLVAEQKVAALAKEEHVALTEGSTGAGMGDMTSDPLFDTKFAEAMRGDHKRDVADVSDARDSTPDPKLKKLLSELLPMLQKHEEMAQKIIDSEAKQ